MRLTALCCCVNYSDLFAHSISRWHQGCERLLVVTDSKDKDTQQLCQRHNVETHVTDIFYANRAHFNKGAALAEMCLAFGIRQDVDWLMTFDADIVPPADWRDQLDGARITPGRLYGAYRYQQPEDTREPFLDYRKKMPQGWVLGFFTVFHSRDRHLPPPENPLFDLHWPHAGNYDTAFTNRWGKQEQVILAIPMIHLGQERQHWAGRGKQSVLQDQFFRRRPGIEVYDHERLPQPPTLLSKSD
jgi:hypothetical protein